MGKNISYNFGMESSNLLIYPYFHYFVFFLMYRRKNRREVKNFNFAWRWENENGTLLCIIGISLTENLWIRWKWIKLKFWALTYMSTCKYEKNITVSYSTTEKVSPNKCYQEAVHTRNSSQIFSFLEEKNYLRVILI